MFLLIDYNFSILSEDTLESWNNRSHLDDLFDESCDLSLDLSVVWIVYNFPVILLFVKYSVNPKDGNDLLRVTMDVLLEIDQTVLYCCLQRLCQLFVQLFEEVEPLGLNVLLAG